MKQTIGLNKFRDAFQSCGRGEQFSYEGLEVLFKTLMDIETGTGQEMELDVIALCCEFVEMTEQEVKDSYISSSEYDDVEDFLCDFTYYCGRTEQNTLIFQQF